MAGENSFSLVTCILMLFPRCTLCTWEQSRVFPGLLLSGVISKILTRWHHVIAFPGDVHIDVIPKVHREGNKEVSFLATSTQVLFPRCILDGSRE